VTAAPWSAEVARARRELTLHELLRRCHRDELLPLAQVLGVNPDGLGTGKLAEVCAWALRRAGGHELANLVKRRGRGPGYPRVLRELAERLGVTAEPTLERTELAIMAAWLEQSKGSLDDAQRHALSVVFAARDPTAVPLDGVAQSTALAPRPHSPAPASSGSSGKLVAAGGALRVLPLFMPLLGPATVAAGLWWLGRPKDATLFQAVLEVARLRQVVRHRVTVGVVGSPSSGKDAAIHAVFGVETGNINPVAGSTQEVSITRLHDASALFVVNTPGLGDVVESVTEEARQILHHIDVFIYVLNAQGGVQARELADYRTCVAMGRPVLVVVNKIDTIRPRDQERYVADARAKLDAPGDDFLFAAFDPLPQLSPHPIGVAPVQAWLTRQLAELGKDPTELPWVPTALDADVAPPGATKVPEPPVPDDTGLSNM